MVDRGRGRREVRWKGVIEGVMWASIGPNPRTYKQDSKLRIIGKQMGGSVTLIQWLPWVMTQRYGFECHKDKSLISLEVQRRIQSHNCINTQMVIDRCLENGKQAYLFRVLI